MAVPQQDVGGGGGAMSVNSVLSSHSILRKGNKFIDIVRFLLQMSVFVAQHFTMCQRSKHLHNWHVLSKNKKLPLTYCRCFGFT